MREDLVAYLLGGLGEADHRRVERELARDPDLRELVEQLRSQLFPPQDDAAPAEPPADLLDQTCDLVDGVRQGERDGVLPPWLTRAANSAPWFSSGPTELWHRSRWTRADLIAMAGVVLAAAMLFFPAIANSRFRSRITACQGNLQVVGMAMADYSERHVGRFPAIPLRGNRSAAGIFGPVLREQGYLTDDRLLVCPGSRLALHKADFRVPSLVELDSSRGKRLSALHRTMAGSYGYSLGYQERGRYKPPQNWGRQDLALLSDAPSLHLPAGQSGNHSGRGQNVLFEDLRIQFCPTCVDLPLGKLFRNDLGYVEAGVDKDDSVIGSSAMRPFMVAH